MLDINNFEPYTLEKVKPLILTTTFKSKNRNKEKEYKNIITFDIETTTISKEKAPMYIWQINVNGRNFYGRYWEEFVEFINYLKSLDHLSYIWVHNLKFEFHYIQSKLDFYDEDLIKVKSHAVIRARTDNVVFRCTYAMTNESLKDLAKENDLHDDDGNEIKKLPGWLFDYKKIRTSDTELSSFELAYCREDVNILYYYLRKIMKDYKNFDSIPITATAFMREIYFNNINNYDDSRFITEKVKMFTVSDLERFNVLQDAFSGAYTHGDLKYMNMMLEKLRSRDKASFYPSMACRKKYPYNLKEIKDEETFYEMYNEKDKYGNCENALIVTVKYTNLRAKTSKTYLSLHKAIKVDGKPQIFGSYYDDDKKLPDDDNGRVYSCKECVYTLTECDLDIVDQIYDYDKMEFIRGLWGRKKYLPLSFLMTILELYRDKTTLKGILDRIGEYFAKKAKLNACYGFTVENPLRAIITYLHDTFEFKEEELAHETSEDLANLRKKLKEHGLKRKNLYVWGIYITAYCRQEIARHIIALGEKAKYSDTDSLKYNWDEMTEKYFEEYDNTIVKGELEDCYKHINSVLSARGFDTIKWEDYFEPETIKGKKKLLGAMEVEEDYRYFKYLGAKRYIAVTEDNQLHCTVCGIKKDDLARYLLGIDDKADDWRDRVDWDSIDYDSIFDNFNFDLEVPPEKSGCTTTYFTKPTYEEYEVTDYQNHVTKIMDDTTGIALIDAPFSLKIGKEFKKCIKLTNNLRVTLHDFIS